MHDLAVSLTSPWTQWIKLNNIVVTAAEGKGTELLNLINLMIRVGLAVKGGQSVDKINENLELPHLLLARSNEGSQSATCLAGEER